MANVEEGRALKSKVRNKDSSQQTMTITFVPETEPYSRPKNMEEYIRTYFEGINGINRRIIAEERKVIAQNRNSWSSLSIEERDKLLNDRLISANVRQKYDSKEDYWREKTPWQPERIIESSDVKPVHRTDSMLNDSFSKPFQWATKSQRNLRFPVIKQEKQKKVEEKDQVEPNEGASKKASGKGEAKSVAQEETLRKLNNVELSAREKHTKTANENIMGTVKDEDRGLTANVKLGENKPSTSNIVPGTSPDVQEKSSEQPKVPENEYMDGSRNIFEFLQSWNP